MGGLATTDHVVGLLQLPVEVLALALEKRHMCRQLTRPLGGSVPTLWLPRGAQHRRRLLLRGRVAGTERRVRGVALRRLWRHPVAVPRLRRSISLLLRRRWWRRLLLRRLILRLHVGRPKLLVWVRGRRPWGRRRHAARPCSGSRSRHANQADSSAESTGRFLSARSFTPWWNSPSPDGRRPR